MKRLWLGLSFLAGSWVMGTDYFHAPNWPAWIALIFLGVAIQYVPRRITAGIEAGFSRLRPVLQGLAVALMLFLIGALGPQGPALFLYFRF